MALVRFYEKPGCLSNARQKQLLKEAGHQVLEINLLTESWQADKARLRAFFGHYPVAQWFNPNAPKIKRGELNPALLDEEQALQLLATEPILIRRPLMEVGAMRVAGFDLDYVDAWIGLQRIDERVNLEMCPL